MRCMRIPYWTAAVLLTAAACSNPGRDPTASGYSELAAEQVMYGGLHSITSGGVRSALLRSDTLYMRGDSSRLDLFGVHLLTYDESGRERAIVTSHTGQLFTDTERMVARGNVVVIVDGGEQRIETEELFYDPATRLIWSEVHSRYRRGDGAWATGTGFTTDDGFQQVRVQNLGGSAPGARLDER
jgi:LPS export ABC transporter protein LptC